MALNISGNVITALKRANRVVVVTGAGISAESGIPTFRGPGGLWRNYKAEELATPQAFQRDPRLVWEWYDWRRGVCGQAQPTAAHHVVAAMERFYHHFLLVTQNVDGLHARAGSRRMVEVHGSLWRARCLKCGEVVELSGASLEAHATQSLPPTHAGCGGTLRPAVVWFGERYEPEDLQRAFTAVEKAQLVMVIGTSGGVALPVDLATQARQAGAMIVEVNRERTTVSRLAHERLEGRASELLPELWRRVQLGHLSEEVNARARRKARRFIIGIAGPPGAGKSALAQALKAALGQEAAVVPLDGFHFSNARLETLGLRARKGAPETFDRLAFELAIAELRAAQKEVRLPVYSRELHEPVADALTVPPTMLIMIVEGNYLFLWPDVRDALDLRIYLDCDAALARADVIARHQQGGASEEEAVRKFEANDRINTDVIKATRGAAELVVRRDAAGWTVQRVTGT